MFIPRAILLSAVLLLVSCQEEPQAIPDGVLPPEKFAEVLMKHALAESAAGINVKEVRATELDSVYGFDPLAETGVSQTLYDSALAYYSRHPDLYKKVYEKVLNDLSVMESARDGVKADSAAK